MRNSTIYLAVFLCLFLSKVTAQNSFEDRAKAIADKIETITKEEKAALKLEVEAVNSQLENGSITSAEADAKKMKLAEARSKSIENRVAEPEKELKELVQDKVDGTVMVKDTTKPRHEIGVTWKHDKQKKDENGEKRTTSQGVFAIGFNNLATNHAVANSDFAYLRSHFVEWGFTHNTRILKNSNLLHAKYGLSFMYNMLKPTENRVFVDNQFTGTTDLEVFPRGLRQKDSYFKNVFITLPLHLEFDFSKKEMKDDKRIFRTHQGFRVGLGGFVGYNINSKQYLSYRVDGYRINERQKGNFNVNDWNYGASAYIGYKETSLYVKYDMNPMFKNNAVDQNNISAGVRFDLN